MIDFKFSGGTLPLLNGDFVLVDGAERVRQQIEIRLNLWRGEWFLDSDFGTPYTSEVLGKGVNPEAAVSAIKREVLAVDGVTSIESLTYSVAKETRKLSLSFAARTDYGLIEFPG